MKLKGIGASNGIAVARVYELKESHVEIKETKVSDVAAEIAKVDAAIATTIAQIEVIKATALKNLGEEEAMVFDAHIQVASDPSMSDEIKNMITSDSVNAVYAADVVSKNFAAMFESMDDDYMRERAADIKDVAKRLIYALAGVKMASVASIDYEAIIVAEDLTPSDTAQLNKDYAKGFVTNIGGRTSHAAIMARSLEIPAVLGLKDITDKVKEGDVIAMDGNSGQVLINPTEAEIAEFKIKAEKAAKEKAENQLFIGKKSLTADGVEVELGANIGAPKDIIGANENDAQAIGLFRSEFLYMDAKN